MSLDQVYDYVIEYYNNKAGKSCVGWKVLSSAYNQSLWLRLALNIHTQQNSRCNTYKS